MSVKKPKKPAPKKSRRAKAIPQRPRKKAATPPSRRTRLLRVLIPIAMLGVGALSILWRRIDTKVAQRLTSFESPSVPVLYSAPLDLRAILQRSDADSVAKRAFLREALTDRRYTEIVGPPTRQGEYSITPESISIFPRDFTAASGLVYRAQKVTLPLIPQGKGESASPYKPLLEPQVISYLGAEEVRASRFVPLDRIPLVVQTAVIAIEDERFYKHLGVDPIGIARAMMRNIAAGRLAQGGSTLTQQLAKNLFLSPKKTITRKLLEIPTAFSLERHLSKKQLLELYLNEVYLGQEGSVSIHGMPQAATTLFGKNISSLTPDEAALLAGIIKAPSYYNPRRHPERAKERRDTVLTKMHELGYITSSEYSLALKRPLKITDQQENRRIAPFFATTLEAELSETIDMENAPANGLAVYTGLDLGVQRCAEAAVTKGLAALESTYPRLTKGEKPLEAALVAIEPHSGLVRAWVGGRDYGQSQFNHVSQAVRQIGSTIKPFLYLTALDGSRNSYKVATAASVLEDKPMEIRVGHQPTWSPENYDHEFRGDVSLRYALENSLNMPALYIAERVGLPALKRTLRDFKLATTVQEVPSLALGALDTTLLRLTAAYGALANGGVYIQPRLFTAAIDSVGLRLASSELVEERVSDEGATFILTDILEGVIDRGTGKAVRAKGFTRPAAGKTGTSDNARDAWFVGYTPTLVAGVWVGFDDNSPTGVTGGVAAAPIWGDFMKCSAPFVPAAEFVRPPSVTSAVIDTKSGQLATSECPESERLGEVFLQGTQPTRRCALHPGGGSEPGSGDREGSRESGFWGSLFGG